MSASLRRFRQSLQAMLRQLVAGQGCTEDGGPSTTSNSNPLAGWFSQLLGSSKQNEYLPEVRLPVPTFSTVDREKIRNRSHIHTRHLFPGMCLPSFAFPHAAVEATRQDFCSQTLRPKHLHCPHPFTCTACRCTARGAGATAADISAFFEHRRPHIDS